MKDMEREIRNTASADALVTNRDRLKQERNMS